MSREFPAYIPMLENSVVSPHADDGLEMETPAEERERLYSSRNTSDTSRNESDLSRTLAEIAESQKQEWWIQQNLDEDFILSQEEQD